MSKLERQNVKAAEISGLDLNQLLTDLNGLERLQSMQLSLVRSLRQQVETACESGGSGSGRSRRRLRGS
ncbi:MAG: hypothetical protein KDA75_18075 [Planctomycetaceae bacterium]|nr:hypothetical protein [Planctomycetaceae bacterium]